MTDETLQLTPPQLPDALRKRIVRGPEFNERTIITLDHAGEKETRTTAMAVTPRSGNAIEIKPRRRDE